MNAALVTHFPPKNAGTTEYAHEAAGGVTAEYSHSYHAGNIGDVWKHVVLLGVIEELIAGYKEISFFDTHAGRGAYELANTGEWTEGVGALVKNIPEGGTGIVSEYCALVKKFGFSAAGKCSYPGSPLIAATRLRANDKIVVWEIDGATAEGLKRNLEGRKVKAEVFCGDGLGGIGQRLRTAGPSLIHIDPPWSRKQDWIEIPNQVAALAKLFPQATIMLWYPIKSYTRVAACFKLLEAAGVSFLSADLITFPLTKQRNRLNGSGLILLNVGPAVVAEIAAAGAKIGVACGISRFWELRMTAHTGGAS